MMVKMITPYGNEAMVDQSRVAEYEAVGYKLATSTAREAKKTTTRRRKTKE